MIALAAVACGWSAAAAQAPAGLEVSLEAPDGLIVGDRAAVIAHVRLQPANDLPLLVTPSAEGPAVEVVRGRLLRADAEGDASAPGALRFAVPVVAKSPGTAVLRVRAMGWVCDHRCRQAIGESTITVRVRARLH